MIEATFRDHVRSRTDPSMVTEALCKIFCHTVVVVHQSAVELGIDATFFAAPQPSAPAVVKFPGVAQTKANWSMRKERTMNGAFGGQSRLDAGKEKKRRRAAALHRRGLGRGVAVR